MADYGERVFPEHKDKYYVYALLRPNGVPFYIGKGKGNRINEHFGKHSLKVITRKNGMIKKYGSRVRREILAYVTDETNAYMLEESLIASYGLLSEGGCLANHSRGRWDNNYAFNTKGETVVTKKYSDELVRKALHLLHTEEYCLSDVAKQVGIPHKYLTTVVNGERRKYIVDEFPPLSKDKRERLIKERMTRSRVCNHILTDEIVLKLFDIYQSGIATTAELAAQHSVTRSYLAHIFNGSSRPYLKLKSKNKIDTELTAAIKQQVFYLRSKNLSHRIIGEKLALSPSRVRTILNDPENKELFSISALKEGLNGS